VRAAGRLWYRVTVTRPPPPCGAHEPGEQVTPGTTRVLAEQPGGNYLGQSGVLEQVPAGRRRLVVEVDAGWTPAVTGAVQLAAGGVAVDWELAFPPLQDPYQLVWTCTRTADPDNRPSGGCAAVVAVSRSDGDNIRASLLLLMGTILGFGLQVLYDHVKPRV
jgi:hypothetical protein